MIKPKLSAVCFRPERASGSGGGGRAARPRHTQLTVRSGRALDAECDEACNCTNSFSLQRERTHTLAAERSAAESLHNNGARGSDCAPVWWKVERDCVESRNDRPVYVPEPLRQDSERGSPSVRAVCLRCLTGANRSGVAKDST